MNMTALIMAGGIASRMKAETEKPLIQVAGKPMVRLVINALKDTKEIDRILVAVSSHTPMTGRVARELGVEVVETKGEGYEQDMKSVIKQKGLKDVLVISADLPFLSGSFLNDAIEAYKARKKPALSVMVPVSLVERQGAIPSYVFEIEGRRLAPVGVNIIDGTRIDEPRLEETVLVTESNESILNVNTPQELALARNMTRGNGTDMKQDRSPVTTFETRASYQIARISVFCALSVVGSFIHLPGPVQTVAFDSAPGFFAALYFGSIDGAAVFGIGHIITSFVNGFPLGILHIPIAIGLGFAGAATGFVNRRFNAIFAAIVGIFVNTVLILIAVPALGWAGTISFLPFLFFAAVANAGVGTVAYYGVKRRLRP